MEITAHQLCYYSHSFQIASLQKEKNSLFILVRMQHAECCGDAKLKHLIKSSVKAPGNYCNYLWLNTLIYTRILTPSSTEQQKHTCTKAQIPPGKQPRSPPILPQCCVPRVSCVSPILLPQIQAAGRHTEFP